MKLVHLGGFLLCLSFLIVCGCGGGGTAEGVTTATVKIATSGSLPDGTSIGGITAQVLASPSTGLSLGTGEVAVTGAGAGATMVPNVSEVADVTLGLISATGIQSGEFATLIYHVAPGASVTADSFRIADGSNVVDLHGVTIPAVGVAIKSVSFQ
jgi:hypothetical protein